MEIILASSNKHKAEEFSTLLPSSLFTVLSAPEKIEVDETGETYQENALLKAEAYYQKYKKPVLADDSGLTVLALPRELAVKSARFGGEGLTDRDRTNLLLNKMEKVKEEQRGAYFSCVLCFYLSPGEIFFFEGRVEGFIGHEIKGEKGFGYDPVFIPAKREGNETLAMIPDWKEKNSHRAVATQLATKFFQERNCQT